MNKSILKFLLTFCFFFSLSILKAQNKPNLSFKDTLYSDKLKTVQFYQVLPNTEKDVVLPAVLKLGADNHLRLEFDLLEPDFRDLQARIYYCSTNWDKIVPVSRMDYLNAYNEFDIFNREFSSGTRVEYCHYAFDVPKVNYPGNYILQIIETNSRKPLLERRFLIHSEEVNVSTLLYPSRSNLSSIRQFNIAVDASNTEIESPMQNLKIFIRKNGLPHTRKGPLKVTYYNQIERLMEVKSLDGSNTFEAGNEYRKFDMRSRYFKGMRINGVKDEGEIIEVLLELDESRRILPYSRDGDINGRFVIDNYEFDDGAINSDYFLTLFSLNYTLAPGDVYVYGALTDWELKEEFKLSYNPELQRYAGVALLKQGYYNYQYVLVRNGKIDNIYFEGSFMDTENYYEVLVYYQVPGRAEEFLVGYLYIQENGWNE